MDIQLNTPININYNGREITATPFSIQIDCNIYRLSDSDSVLEQRFNHDQTTSWFFEPMGNDEEAEEIGRLIEIELTGETNIDTTTQ